MPVTSETSAPYATSSGIMDIISRYRHRGMQTPINGEVIGRAGVSDSLISRTIQALTVLDLIDDEGMPTETFEGIRLSPETEYKQRLAEWLRSVYSDVFSFVDPLEDDEIRIRDAFRTYRPAGQQSRMVSLFIGLCNAAGLRPELSIEQKPNSIRKAGSANKTRVVKAIKGSTKTKGRTTDNLPSALEGLMKSLPDEKTGWTKEQHDKFLTTFEAVLDFCYPIVEKTKGDQSGEEIDAD